MLQAAENHSIYDFTASQFTCEVSIFLISSEEDDVYAAYDSNDAYHFLDD